MANSAIEWTQRVWNPIVGCTIHSPGCKRCYAMRMAWRLQGMAAAGNEALAHYVGTVEQSKAGPVWTGKVSVAPDDVLTAPLRRKKPTNYFVNSMSDLFHADVPDEVIDRVFAVMALCPQHTLQLLTKRADRMRAYGTDPKARHRIAAVIIGMMNSKAVTYSAGFAALQDRVRDDDPETIMWPLPNVWLGVSVEDQARALQRIPDLLGTPAAVRWLSCEPLLGPIYLTDVSDNGTALDPECWGDCACDSLYGFDAGCRRNGGDGNLSRKIDWVVVGGESGPGARPMHPDWVREIRDNCAEAGVPFFFKQWGNWREAAPGDQFDTAKGRANKPPAFIVEPDDGTVHCFLPTNPNPRCRVMLEVGKKRAGRLLDGVEHNGMPA